MSEDRPVEDVPQAIAALRAEFEDFKKTAAANILRLPTGSIEMSFLGVKEGTLLLNGATMNRAEFPQLWQWITDRSLSPSVFGAGNGTTTFVLPDFRTRFPRGADATDVVGEVVGSNTLTLATANLPLHSHGIGDEGNHQHSRSGSPGFTSMAGGHDNHFPAWGWDQLTNGPSGGAISGILARQASSGDDGRRSVDHHNHTVAPGAAAGGHDHGGVTGTAGSATPTAIDKRPASLGVNFLIWT